MNELCPETRWLFVTMMLVSTKDGEINLTRPALARRANLTPTQTDKALEILSASDPQAATDDPTNGRRIELVDPFRRDWGWRVLNKRSYMALTREDEREQMLERKRRQRANDAATLFDVLSANRGKPHVSSDPVTVDRDIERDTNLKKRNEIKERKETKERKQSKETKSLPLSESKSSPVGESESNTQTRAIQEFATAVHRWNVVAPQFGLARVTRKGAATKLTTWKNIRAQLRRECPDDPECAFSLAAVVDHIPQNTFLHHKRWCTFQWLFCSKNGEFNAEKIWHDRYIEDGSRHDRESSRDKEPKRNPYTGNKRR